MASNNTKLCDEISTLVTVTDDTNINKERQKGNNFRQL